MGTVVAQDIFQSKLNAIFIGMEGVTGIADDMIIAGKDKMEHDRNFLAFMEKCMENNLTLNSEKIQFKQKQVSFYWKRMDFLIVADVFSKYFLVRKLANSTSAAVCAEIATIVTELGLPHIIRSDNGPCYNSKELQQLLQCYNITHHTSSPHHPRSNGFVERMVEVAKKLMDKAGSKGKPWISGLYEYRVTPQSGSIVLPLQLITQCTPREKDLPQLPSTLEAQEIMKLTKSSSGDYQISQRGTTLS